MKKAMSNVDVAAIAAELQSRIVGGFFGKAYQSSGETIWLTVQSREGRLDLLLEAGRRAHITKTERTVGKSPPQFPAMLRSRLSGGRIVDVEQHDFDRVLEICVERGDGSYRIVVELFPKGNILLLDESMRIILPLKPMSFRDRRLVAGEQYIYHTAMDDPRSVSLERLEEILRESDTDLVRALVRGLNMGGTYGEEVCLRAGVDKSIYAPSISDADLKKVHTALKEVFDIKEIKPQIVYKDGSPFDVVPFPLEVYRGLESKTFESFSEALDEFFVVEPLRPKPSALERRLELQRAALNELRAKEIEMTSLGDLIYQRYVEIDSLLKAISDAREKGLSYNDIWERIQSSGFSTIKSMDYKGEMVVEIDGRELELNAGLTVPQNAARYYERAKDFAKKAAGAEEALKATEQLMLGGTQEIRKKQLVARRHKPRWFERFRWFQSSDGFLVIGGRDADSNEEIYLKYLEKRDLALHTDYPGAPLTVIKSEGHEVPETTIREAGQFAVSYSNLWREGVASGDCYVVRGDQVTKTPEHGEFLRKGAFVIRGERRYLRDVPLGVGLAIVDDLLIGGPIAAIKSKSSRIIELEPGEYMPDDLAKRIYRQLLEVYEDKRYLKSIASPEKIVAFLPPGGSRIRRFDMG